MMIASRRRKSPVKPVDSSELVRRLEMVYPDILDVEFATLLGITTSHWTFLRQGKRSASQSLRDRILRLIENPERTVRDFVGSIRPRLGL